MLPISFVPSFSSKVWVSVCVDGWVQIGENPCPIPHTHLFKHVHWPCRCIIVIGYSKINFVSLFHLIGTKGYVHRKAKFILLCYRNNWCWPLGKIEFLLNHYPVMHYLQRNQTLLDRFSSTVQYGYHWFVHSSIV